MKIVSIDMNSSSSEQGMGSRHLKLDFAPSHEWKAIFSELHKNLIDFNKRDAYVLGSNIVVNCCMDELQYQIDSLNGICADADERLLAKQEQEQAQERERNRQMQEKRNQANEQYGKLKF